MRSASAALCLALVGALVQALALTTDFYVWRWVRQSAWFGIPHASELILLSALVTVTVVALTAGQRSPVTGRTAGIIIASVGLVAAAQLAYRMIASPFGAG